MHPTTPAASAAGHPSWLGADAVLVPVKRFSEAKLRLAPALSPARRAELARTMAERVVASAGDLPVAVVCDDRDVAAWARAQGALVIWEPGRGLNGAVEEGVARLAAAGVQLVVVAAGDLPLASDLSWVTERWSPEGLGVTIVPDRRADGTNVIAVPTHPTFGFSYGPGSYSRHLAEAERLGLPVRVVHDSPLAWDVDLPADLAALQR
jgi:2-phospho-L-lactate/phosphoenolpyruvate guanylyltransferase